METTLLFVHCQIFLLFAVAASTSSIKTEELNALLALKASITDDPNNFFASNWNNITTSSSSGSPCNWTGVTCDVHGQRVTSLNISSLGLSGTIPPQLANLSSLQSLDFSFNQFSGMIPSSIFSLCSLNYLSFRENQLSGTFPSFLCLNKSSLRYVDLSNNRLSGELPTNICSNLPFLRWFSLSNNSFHGTILNDLLKCRHLQILSLSTNEFSGVIPKAISNLTKLKELYLGINQLTGKIPKELGNLKELQILALARNFITGAIPNEIGKLTKLKKLYLTYNQLQGAIPKEIGNLTKLEELGLWYNQIQGAIPKEVGNLTKLKELGLGYNQIQGEIPHEIGNLHNLELLDLGDNKLVGGVPVTIFNISTLKRLSVANNSLWGRLPSTTQLRLPNLEELLMWGNEFSGPIPNFIFNSSKLSKLDLGNNSFSGVIPNTFGNLRHLRWLSLWNNHLTSSTPELSFLSSLSDCSNLKRLLFGNSPLYGILPRSLGNLSRSLEFFYMFNCSISGGIPKEIGNLTNLTAINIGGNKLNGSIPASIGNLQNLQFLNLGYNNLEGPIPEDLCYLVALSELYLSGNRLEGRIPACFSSLISLRAIFLDSNRLTSTIPSTLWNLNDILHIDFSSNFLTGPLPIEIGNLKVLIHIDLSRNNFSSVIPTTIGGLNGLQFLSMEYNRLQGPIPDSLDNLISLESLNLAGNNLSGLIPISLQKLHNLKHLNVSFNVLQGEIPTKGPFANFTAESFLGNNLLCGSSHLQVPTCKKDKSVNDENSRKLGLVLGIVLPISIVLITLGILGVRFVLISRSHERAMKKPGDANMSPRATAHRISYHELLQATNGFSESNMIGGGGFGSVYRARLGDGTEVAVKIFHEHSEKAWKSFDVECEVMKSIRHRNLVKIITSCSNEDFRALVLEYMPNESLENYLYSNNGVLDLSQRLNIMVDVSSALEYLHFGNLMPVIHCDLKPSNVLLDENMIAHLGDFGIAKLLTGEDQSMVQTQTLATIGYMAPEYGREGHVTTKGDVYSFGILLMEVFTRKKPTDEIFTGEMTLRSWVQDLLSVPSVMDIVDGSISRMEDRHFARKEQCVSLVFNLAMDCTEESPEKRISSKEIANRLLKIRDSFLRVTEGRRMRPPS